MSLTFELDSEVQHLYSPRAEKTLVRELIKLVSHSKRDCRRMTVTELRMKYYTNKERDI